VPGSIHLERLERLKQECMTRKLEYFRIFGISCWDHGTCRTLGEFKFNSFVIEGKLKEFVSLRVDCIKYSMLTLD
jgi:hypothetical protein